MLNCHAGELWSKVKVENIEKMLKDWDESVKMMALEVLVRFAAIGVCDHRVVLDN